MNMKNSAAIKAALDCGFKFYLTPPGTKEMHCNDAQVESLCARLLRIEAAALAIDGIEMRNCVEIPLSAWEDLQDALYGKDKV